MPTLTCEQIGSGPPLVILHGLFGSGKNWRHIAKQLQETHAVFLLDLRNHGASFHDPVMDYEIMAADVEQFLQAQHLTHLSLLGHSMGGKVAMVVATRQPHHVARLMVVDIAPKAYPPIHSPIIAALQSVDVTTVQSRMEVDRQLAERVPDRVTRQFLLANLVRETNGHYWRGSRRPLQRQSRWSLPLSAAVRLGRGAPDISPGPHYRWQWHLEAIAAHYDALIGMPPLHGTFTGPTRFVRGGRSDYLSEEDLPVIHRHFPTATLTTLREAGHWPHIDAPAAFVRLLSAWLHTPPRIAVAHVLRPTLDK
ncbi:MAG: alpha/beta fold hydrolase [Deltaproteobacteria bacterium]|nr:alpha/beta fold hydrolase [Deltaproteobacteria bacterium]